MILHNPYTIRREVALSEFYRAKKQNYDCDGKKFIAKYQKTASDILDVYGHRSYRIEDFLVIELSKKKAAISAGKIYTLLFERS